LLFARRSWPKACLQVAVIGAFAMLSCSCTLGMTRLSKTHYIAVPSEDNVNYFRVRVEGSADLSKVKFASGWFPAEAVDSLYGAADEAGVAEAYKVKNDIKEQYNKAIVSTAQGYLEAAANPNSKPEVIEAWLRAQRRVRATAGAEMSLPAGAIEVEYDPASGLALRHAGEKLVFVMSSNPDDIIGAIARFSKDAEVGATVLTLSDVVRQNAANDVEQTIARNEARAKLNAVIMKRIDVLLTEMQDSTAALDLQKEIDALRIVLEGLR
jgi:hypothetical protein